MNRGGQIDIRLTAGRRVLDARDGKSARLLREAAERGGGGAGFARDVVEGVVDREGGSAGEGEGETVADAVVCAVGVEGVDGGRGVHGDLDAGLGAGERAGAASAVGDFAEGEGRGAGL